MLHMRRQLPSGAETFLGIVYTSDMLLAKSPTCQNGSRGRQRFQEVVPPSGSGLFFLLITVIHYFFLFRWGEERNLDGTSKKYWVRFFI